MASFMQTPGAGVRSGRRPRQTHGDLKEAAILECAWQLLATKPMAEITVEELAAGAGISRSSFYTYFDSRDAVIRAVIEHARVTWFEIGTDIRNGISADPEATFRAMAEAFMQLWLAQGQCLRTWASLVDATDSAEPRAFWDGIVGEVKEALVGAIEDERAAGRALPGPPDASYLAGVLIGMFWSAGHDLSLAPRPEEMIGFVVDTLTAVSYRAIYGQPAESRSRQPAARHRPPAARPDQQRKGRTPSKPS